MICHSQVVSLASFEEVSISKQNSEFTRTQISVAAEECIEQFIAQRKSRVNKFVHQHFSIKETLLIQKKTLLIDLLSNPINSVWSFIYLALKKLIEVFEKLGWNLLSTVFLQTPKGIKTGYQNKIEQMIAIELLDLNPHSKNSSKKTENGLLSLMLQHSVLSKVITSQNSHFFSMNDELQEALARYSAGRALISDLSGSLLTLLMGWIYFGDKKLGLFELSQRIAGRFAHGKAADNFIFGKDLGSSFYKIFPPKPSTHQVFFATLFVVLMLTIFSLVTTALSDPCLKKLGLQQKKLEIFFNDLETSLLIQFKRKIKDLM